MNVSVARTCLALVVVALVAESTGCQKAVDVAFPERKHDFVREAPEVPKQVSLSQDEDPTQVTLDGETASTKAAGYGTKTPTAEPMNEEEMDPATREALKYFKDCQIWEHYFLRKMLKAISFGEDLSLSTLPLQPGEKVCQDINGDNLRRARLAVFARHGRPFSDADLNTFFYEKNADLFKVNPDYTDALLENVDKANQRFLDQWQAE